MVNINTAIETANNFGELRKIADRVYPHLSFFGAEYISSSRYEGTSTIDDLVRKITMLVHRSPTHDHKHRPLYPTLSHREKNHARALGNRIEFLYDEAINRRISSHRPFPFRPFFLLLRNISHAFYNLVLQGTWILSDGIPCTNPENRKKTNK